MILGPREKIYKRHIEHPVFEQKNTQNITNQKPPRMGYVKEIQEPNKRTPNGENWKQFEQQNKEVHIGL